MRPSNLASTPRPGDLVLARARLEAQAELVARARRAVIDLEALVADLAEAYRDGSWSAKADAAFLRGRLIRELGPMAAEAHSALRMLEGGYRSDDEALEDLGEAFEVLSGRTVSGKG